MINFKENIFLYIFIVINTVLFLFLYFNNNKINDVSIKINDVSIKKTDEYVSVKDFGALGNATNDDTKAIQKAHDFLDSNNGGVMYFPPGEYKITDTINIYTEKRLKLLGSFNNRIFMDSNTPKIVFDMNRKNNNSASPILVENIRVDGAIGQGANKNGNTAFNVIGRNIINFNNCEVINNYIGIYFEVSYAPTVNQCMFQNCEGNGILSMDLSINGLVIRDSKFYACGTSAKSAAIALNVNDKLGPGQATLIEGCKIEENFIGILAGNTTSLTIMNNYIEVSKNSNIEFNVRNYSSIIMSNWLGESKNTNLLRSDGIIFNNNTVYNNTVDFGGSTNVIKNNNNLLGNGKIIDV